jgi:hypothetical protein
MKISRLRLVALAAPTLLLVTAMRASAQQSGSMPADSAHAAPAQSDSAAARARRIEGVRVVAPRERRNA